MLKHTLMVNIYILKRILHFTLSLRENFKVKWFSNVLFICFMYLVNALVMKSLLWLIEYLSLIFMYIFYSLIQLTNDFFYYYFFIFHYVFNHYEILKYKCTYKFNEIYILNKFILNICMYRCEKKKKLSPILNLRKS